ncbi:hypothetical protein [Ammoniphilus sp. CFH 90114]|uniref:hypothetical protein n=1 Tax=Ammoniphilus sp. CFH 90114 TaxID=2493665 RepID=UPI0013E93EE4|nr:hypothetical protein [Ammoniphilus sp. CFH 90114]
MHNISDDLFSMRDVYALIKAKEQLKDSILDPALKWDERMVLYQKINDINDRIRQLSNR